MDRGGREGTSRTDGIVERRALLVGLVTHGDVICVVVEMCVGYWQPMLILLGGV